MVKPVHNDSLAVQNSQEQKESSVSSTHSHHDCDLTLNPIDPSAKDLSQLKISQAMGPRKWGTEQQEEIRLTRANNGSLDYIRNAPHSKALLAMGHSGKDVANWQDILQKALDHDPEFKEQALSAGILKSADQKIADGKFGDQTRRLTSLAQLRYRAVEAGGATGQVGRETLTTVEQAVELLKHDCVVGDTKPAAKPETTLAPESAPEPETAPVTDPAPAPAPAPVAAASIGQGNQPEPELEVEVETSTGNIDKSQFGKHAVAGFKDKFMEDTRLSVVSTKLKMPKLRQSLIKLPERLEKDQLILLERYLLVELLT